MNQKELILSNLCVRKKELEKVISTAQRYLVPFMEGTLEVINNRNHYRYYHKCKTSKESNSKGENQPSKWKRKYLKDINVAKRIAEQDYAKKVLESANLELQGVTSLINTYQKPIAEEIFKSMHPGRQLLVEPIILNDEQYAEQWLTNAEKQKVRMQKKHQNTYPIQNPIQTENHEIVRSKSEKIIADKLKLAGVPYIYEKPLQVGKTVKYPDFTALNKRTRQEYYWEHMGLINQPDYFKAAMSKIETYSQNRIWLGKNLIITYETTDTSLNVEWIEQIIEEYLL